MSSYWRIRYANNYVTVFSKSNLDVVYSCLSERESKNYINQK